ncbi:uncharacterized protein LOC130743752 [Lotus japonicus]|uniref:uncharacterized protein LOC130743752 n=1 Tax=Lotus japonicus TaxID=34305 RepID=UPI002583236C|nr:uncharacterized protein LOC130743752 [Lotus japonicus]
MDKQNRGWIKLKDRTLPEYLKGIDDFLNFAFSGSKPKRFIRCPCSKCNNFNYKSRDDVMHDLLKWGFEPSYERWEYHGESLSDASSDNDAGNDCDVDLETSDNAQTYSMIYDMHQSLNMDRGNVFDNPGPSSMNEEPNKDAKRFYGLLKDAEQKLYPGCQKFSKLSFIMRLFQMKCVYGWSNNSFDSLIKLLVEALPEGNVLPNSMYEIHKTIRDLGLDYVKIDACVNDCILFRGEEYENLDKCPKCGESRWQEKKKKNVVPNKVVRYFPIKPRLQRLFMSKQIADDMKWLKNKRVDDEVMRHPADSLAWKRFDDNHELFASDPRNVRLGLASDGFNPFGIMSTNYSVWPVVLIPYNLPPWLCMKQPNFILTLLIPSPKGLGIDIDVYLQPLIDDLKDLWDEGIETYDASSR